MASAGALGMVLLSMLATPASANTQIVTNCNDSGSGSLRQAIANAGSGDTVAFALSPACSTIDLASTLTITTSLTIDGPGAGVLAVSGQNTVRDFVVDGGVTASISGLTIEDGYNATSGGGGIYSLGILTVSNSAVTGNTANLSSDGGGGILNEGTLVITNSSVSGNTANGAGGGIANDNSGSLTIVNTTVAGNTATSYAGGIQSVGSLTVTNSTVAGNTATSYGGGIQFNGSLTVTNSTVAGNTATSIGGGFLSDGSLTMANSTVAGNTVSVGSGGGIAGPAAFLQATIVANNVGGDCDVLFPIDNGYNIDDDGSCGFSGTSVSNSATLDASLGTLANNGGPTQTIALKLGSPAIDKVPSADCPATDQRGAPRTAPCDIGAYDTDGLTQTITYTSTAPSNAMVGGPTYTVTATGGSSGNAVTFSSTSPACSVSGSTVSFIAAGTCTIDAYQAGNSNYQAAPTVPQSFTVASSAPPPPPPPPPSPPTITESCQTSAVVGKNYSCLITTTGSPGPTITINGLPGGLSEFLGSYETVWIVGVPTTSGTYPITVAATNPSGTSSQNFTLSVEADPTFTSAATASIPAKKHSTLTVTASGTPNPVISANGLPAWLTLGTGHQGRNSTPKGTTTLSAKKPKPGTYTFTLTATNAVGTTIQTFKLIVTG